MGIEWHKLRGRTTFILGGQKHAGKTTFMTYALRKLRATQQPVAYMSTGVDGEGRDAISGLPKPIIQAEAGDLVVTTEASLDASNSVCSVLHVFDEATVMGRPVIVEIRHPGRLELLGPGSNRRLGEAIEWIRFHIADATILVDGAADRITQAAAASEAAVVMVMKVTPATHARARDRARLLAMLAQLPLACEAPADAAHLSGAVTPFCVSTLSPRCSAVVFDDFTKVFLSYSELKQLARRCKLYLSTQHELLWIVAVLQDVSWGAFTKGLDEAGRSFLVANPFMEPQPC